MSVASLVLSSLCRVSAQQKRSSAGSGLRAPRQSSVYDQHQRRAWLTFAARDGASYSFLPPITT
jgi:hypothetical protein